MISRTNAAGYSQVVKAWAINLRLDYHDGFLGVLGVEPQPKPWRDGLRTALWRTRREARQALKDYLANGGQWARDHYWNRARVERVSVTIRVI